MMLPQLHHRKILQLGQQIQLLLLQTLPRRFIQPRRSAAVLAPLRMSMVVMLLLLMLQSSPWRRRTT